MSVELIDLPAEWDFQRTRAWLVGRLKDAEKATAKAEEMERLGTPTPGPTTADHLVAKRTHWEMRVRATLDDLDLLNNAIECRSEGCGAVIEYRRRMDWAGYCLRCFAIATKDDVLLASAPPEQPDLIQKASPGSPWGHY
jgi:hypothetical protein